MYNNLSLERANTHKQKLTVVIFLTVYAIDILLTFIISSNERLLISWTKICKVGLSLLNR